MISDTLTGYGWHIDTVCSWADQGLELNSLLSTGVLSDADKTPIDQSALFAGRHFGVLKDAKDYLDWEERLPELIPPTIKDMWQDRLRSSIDV